MMKLKLSKILEMLIECTYLGAIFFVPLFFSVFPKTSNVFEVSKMTLFRVLVQFLFLFIFAHFFIQDEIRKRTVFFLRTRGKYLLIPSVYVLGLSIITYFSSFSLNSFKGNHGYQMGLYSYLYFYIFYFLLIYWIKSREQINRILVAVVFSSFFVCIYGLIQAFGLDILDWAEASQGRIFSTLGQPNYLASYLLLAIPISVFLFIDTKKRYAKILISLTILMQFACLMLTYSRGGQLAFFIGLASFFLLYLGRRKRVDLSSVFYRKTNILLILIVLLGLSLIWINAPARQKDRFRYAIDFKQGSVASRLDFYRAGWQGFKLRPLLGYGLENQKEIMVSYYEKDWALYNNVNTVPHQAHNIFLDCLLTGGLFGLFLYLLLNGYFVFLAVSNIRLGKLIKLSWLILFAWFCYFISLIFGFAVIVTEIYFFLFLAILATTSCLGQGHDEVFQSEMRKNKAKIVFKIFIISVFVVLVSFQFNRELKVVIADHYFYKLESALAKKSYFEAYLLYEWIEELNVETEYYDIKFSNYLADAIDVGSNETWSEAAKRIIFPRIILKLENDTYEAVCVRAKMYAAMASEKEYGYYQKAEQEFVNCINKAKGIPENYREYAKFYFKKKEYDRAFENLKLAQEKLPSLDNKMLNDDHGSKVRRELYLINRLYGDIYLEKKEYNSAEDSYSRAQEYSSQDFIIYKKIADTHYLRGDLIGAIGVIEEVTEKDQDNYFWPFLVAQIYLELGEKEKASGYANNALLLSPKNQDVIKLISSLE